MPLSSKDLERLALAWQCFETEPKIDYEKFAKVANLKTPASARELMRVTKNKLKNEYGALSAGLQKGGANSTAAATPKKKVTAATAVGENGTPTPTPRKRKASAKAVEADADADGEDYEEAVQKSPKKKAKAKGGAVQTPEGGEGGDGGFDGGSPVKAEPDAEGEAEDFGFF